MKFLTTLISFVSVLLSAVILFAVAAPTITSFDADGFLTRLSAAGIDTECDIIFTVSKGGSINMESGIYPVGQQLDLVATPEEDYLFSGWYDEKHTLLSLNPSFSFTAEEDRHMYVSFSPVPEKTEVSYETKDELRDCNQNFQITVSCDQANAIEYIKENLVIADNFYASADLTDEQKELVSNVLNMDFTVTENEDGTYTVSADVPYEKGSTYTASLSGEEEAITIVGAEESNSLTFTIEEEEHETITYRTDILHLTPDQILSFSGDDSQPGITLASLSPFEGYENGGVGATVRIDEDEADDRDTMYGKVTEIREQGDVWLVSLTAPDLDSIFNELDVYGNATINLENDTNLQISDEALAQIEQQFLASEGFQTYLAATYLGARSYLEENGYDVSSMGLSRVIDMLQIQTDVKISGDTVTFYITASLNAGVADDTVLFLAFDYTESARFSFVRNIEMKKRLGAPYGIQTFDVNVTTHETKTFTLRGGLRFGEGNESPEQLATDRVIEQKALEAMGNEAALRDSISSIQEFFRQKNWTADSNVKTIQLGSLYCTAGIFSLNIDLSCEVGFDLNALISYTNSSVTTTTNGYRMNANGNIEHYSSQRCSSSADHIYLMGNAGTRTGLSMEFYISLIGFNNWLCLDISGTVGVYTEAAGILGIAQADRQSTGVAAGYVELGFYGSFSGFYKFFTESDPVAVSFWNTEMTLARYGFTDAYVMLSYQSDKEAKVLDVTAKETDLGNCGIYNVITYSAEDQRVDTATLQEALNGYSIKLSLKDGKYVSIQDGKLVVNEDAPAVFQDELTIEVVGDSKRWSSLATSESYICYAKPIKVSIHYHNDGYVDSTYEARFRNLYKSYNESNAALLQSAFTDYMQNLFEGAEEENVFVLIIEAYAENLFDHLSALKSQEDSYGTQEALFIQYEPDAFEALYGYVSGILQAGGDYRPTEASITNMLDCVALSPCIMATLSDVTSQIGGSASALVTEFHNMPAEVQEVVTTTLQNYYRQDTASADAKLVCSQIAGLLEISLAG